MEGSMVIADDAAARSITKSWLVLFSWPEVGTFSDFVSWFSWLL